MEGPAPSAVKQLPQRATFGDKPGKLLQPRGYLSTRHGLGQTGHTGCILTGDVELDGSAGHQLYPEQKNEL